MQLPETPPPPLAPLWDRVQRARALPPDLDVGLLYIAIRDRLIHPEWEVRLHALRVLADLLPLSGNALSFPFDQVVDNLGHNSPNVRKAALDALKVFCNHCEDPECATRAILDKCSYHNIRPHSADISVKVNVITGLILSMPSVMVILKRRQPSLDAFPVFQVLGHKLFDVAHKDVAFRSMLKLRRVTGPREYMICLSKLDSKVQEKFRYMYETYDDDAVDVFYGRRKAFNRDNNNQQVSTQFSSPRTTPIRLSTDSSSSESVDTPFHNNNHPKVIIETEIKFDSDTAITMTVLEENETESDRNTSEDDYDSSDRKMLRFSEVEVEDTDVVVKKVRFGGESVKIRTPDSENHMSSEDDVNRNKYSPERDNMDKASRPVNPVIVNKMNEIRSKSLENERNKTFENDNNLNNHNQNRSMKKSGIPLPIISHKFNNNHSLPKHKKVKLKSKSLSELYDYFQTKTTDMKPQENSGFALTVSESMSPEKVPSPVEPHREVEVFHNLQRSPVLSPKRKQKQLQLEENGYVLNLVTSAGDDSELSPRAPAPLKPRYDWEDLDIVPAHVVEQLHNTENWITAVKAADQLHSALLERETVRQAEGAALSLVQHMWALSDAVPAARAPAEGAVCALLRGADAECARRLLPALVARLAREPAPAALPHALLQRLALHHLVDLLFDTDTIGWTGDAEEMQEAQLRATLCLARAAGPAAVLSAVRRRLSASVRADIFCSKLRERLSRPVEHIKPCHVARSSQLPVSVRRRARSTPGAAGAVPPRRLRPLPDSAPNIGMSQSGSDLMKPLSPIPLSDRDSSAFTGSSVDKDKFSETKVEELVIEGQTEERPGVDELDDPAPASPVPAPRSPSLRIENYSEKSNEPSIYSFGSPIKHQSSFGSPVKHQNSYGSPVKHHGSFGSPIKQQDSISSSAGDTGSQKSLNEDREATPSRSPSRKSTISPLPSQTLSVQTLSVPASPVRSQRATPEPAVVAGGASEAGAVCERDVRTALAECIVPARLEDWELIVHALVETARLAADPAARAPAPAWRAATRSVAGHARSLRSRVARTACATLGALFERRGRLLDPELEDAATALLERCADVNKFLRADAAAALVQLACGASCARAAVALCRKGAAHRSGAVRAAAARALARLVAHSGAARVLDMPPEARGVLLRTAGELLGDASADTRLHARQLCLALAEDQRFHPMLKEAMVASRYRAIEKYVDKLKCR